MINLVFFIIEEVMYIFFNRKLDRLYLVYFIIYRKREKEIFILVEDKYLGLYIEYNFLKKSSDIKIICSNYRSCLVFKRKYFFYLCLFFVFINCIIFIFGNIL